MQVSELEVGSRPVEWDDFVRDCGDGTPFHLLAWKRVVESAFGHRPHYLMAKRAGGLEGVLPLFEVRGLLGGRALVSIPYAVYGGICASSDPARQALLDAAQTLARRRQVAYVELRHRNDQGLNLPTKRRYVGFSRPIFPTEEANARAIPQKQRRMTRQGSKHGLRAEIGHDHFDAFFDIYARNLRRLGSPLFPKRLLAGVLEFFGKDCQILSVWKDDQIVAAVQTIFYKDQVMPYYGAARHEARAWAANDYMYWALMCHGMRAGYRVFDFGRSREGAGSYDFKRHWGFDAAPLPYQYLLRDGQTMPDLSPSNPVFRLAIRAWPHLPLGLTQLLGPIANRYLP